MKTETLCQFYSDIVGVSEPWEVTAVDTDDMNRKVTIRVEYCKDKIIACPLCADRTTYYDDRVRVLRYLDTCQYKTFLEVHVPRIKCKKDGVQQIDVPFAEKHSRFTARFERAVLLWLDNCPISKVAENMNLSWDEVDGILQRAVQRGLNRRKKIFVRNLGIDETSYRKRHKYVTILYDKDSHSILDVIHEHTAESLDTWFKTQKHCDFTHLDSISMDMWDPFIKAVMENIPNWEQKICFDRFHIAKHFNEALDKVRRREHSVLLQEYGKSPLTKSRYQWLVNSEKTDNRKSKRKDLLALSRLNLETARAWRIKEQASTLWDYIYMNVAEIAWRKLLRWISLCRIPEIIKVGQMVRNYFWGILNTIRLKMSNGVVEAVNNRIQHIKRIACGFRNRDRFRNAILFHYGNLNMSFSSTF